MSYTIQSSDCLLTSHQQPKYIHINTSKNKATDTKSIISNHNYSPSFQHSSNTKQDLYQMRPPIFNPPFIHIAYYQTQLLSTPYLEVRVIVDNARA